MHIHWRGDSCWGKLANLISDFEKGYMKFSIREDVAMPASTKRAAIEGTPDKEAEQRSRVSPSQVAPCFGPSSCWSCEQGGNEWCNNRGIEEDDAWRGEAWRVAARLDQSLGFLKDQFCEEKEARQKLEERVRLFNDKIGNNVAKGEPDDDVDKSVVVLGGFREKELEEAHDLVNRVMAEVDGFKEVHFTNNIPTIALADFETPMKAMKFIPSQRRNAEMQHAKLWASDNRSTQERQKGKITSKLKKFMIELERVEPKDVLVNYKSFKVMVRQGGKLCPVAVVGEDMDVQWSNDGVPAVREALDAFIAELGWGKGMSAKHGCRKFGSPDDRIGHSTDDANHGGDGFEFIHLHVVTKNIQSIKSDDRFHDLIAELN